MKREENLERELESLRKEVERLKETSARRGWQKPQEIIKQALEALEFFHQYYGSGVGSQDGVREVIKILDADAMKRVSGGQHAYGEGLLYGFARLLEDVYLGPGKWHKEAHGEANRKRIEENRRRSADSTERSSK